MTTDTTVLEDAAVEVFAEKVLGDMAGAYSFFMGAIGDRLGLFKDLAGRGRATSHELADRNGLAERYVREWLRGMAAAGYLDYDPVTTQYEMPPHREPVLAEAAGTDFFGAALFNFSANFGDSIHHLLGRSVPGTAYREPSSARPRRQRLDSPHLGSSICWCRSGCRPCRTCTPGWTRERRSATWAAARVTR